MPDEARDALNLLCDAAEESGMGSVEVDVLKSQVRAEISHREFALQEAKRLAFLSIDWDDKNGDHYIVTSGAGRASAGCVLNLSKWLRESESDEAE